MSSDLDLIRQGEGIFKNLFNSFVTEAHKTGFDSPFLRSCLYVYAGGSRMPGKYVERNLKNIGLVNDASELTSNGQKLFIHMSYNTTSIPYRWAHDIADSRQVNSVLRGCGIMVKKPSLC